MLPKNHRLSSTRDIALVFREGKAVKTPSAIIRVLRGASENSRFAVLVSARVARRASLRNRIKRVMREALRAELKRIPEGYDVVVSVKRVPERVNLSWAQEISGALTEMLR